MKNLRHGFKSVHSHKLVLALSVDATKRRLKISKISPASNPQTEEQF